MEPVIDIIKIRKLVSLFFSIENKIEITDLLKLYSEIPISEKFKFSNICEPFDYSNRKIKWDMTFHMGECLEIGHIRTQYDEVIEYIVEGLLFENYDINKVYLPLLFLIRHSLELALKFNLQNAKKLTLDKVPTKDYDEMHSLSQLYNCFGGKDGYLAKLDLSKMPDETKQQFYLYKKQYEGLNDIVHQLDNNSTFFRFPVDKKGKLHTLNMNGQTLGKILQLYYLTDPFITFTVDVLENDGII
jgi:hypothetical protein